MAVSSGMRDPMEGDGATADAAVMRQVVWGTVLIALTFLVLGSVALPNIRPRGFIALGVVGAVGGSSLWLINRGRLLAGARLYVAGFVTLVNVMAWTGGGVWAAGLFMNPVMVLTTGLLLGERAATTVGLFAVGLALLMAVAEYGGWLPESMITHTPVSMWLFFSLVIGLVIVLQRVSSGVLREALSHARSEIEERKAAERERDRLVLDLRERVKELTVLHGVARLLEHDRPFDHGLLKEIVRLLPAGWLQPESCVARIRCGPIEARSEEWRETPWMLTSRFAGDGEVSVAYLKEPFGTGRSPFIDEERALLDSIAEMLGTHLAHRRSKEERERLEEQLRRSQKLQALGTLSGGIAHDFNNLLAAIRANVTLAMDDLDPHHPTREYVSEVGKAGDRAADMVRRILLFSRQEEGEFRAMHVRPVVEDAIDLLRSTAPPGVRIELDCDPELPPISGDPTQIHQVVMNLGTNAFHAMAESGGSLRVELGRSGKGAGASEGAPPGGAPPLSLTVRDTGVGMTPEVMQRMFDPFFTTKGPDRGTGLGLSVVHGIVHGHGGTIRVESEVGRGTALHILLPVEEAPVRVEKHPEGPTRGGGEVVMYVDDDTALSAVMTKLLRRLGYEPETHTDPHAALEAFRRGPERFHAVVVDQRMPGMRGSELAKELRALRPGVPIAFTSGDRFELGESPAEPPTDVFIPKPVSMGELSRLLRTLLGA